MEIDGCALMDKLDSKYKKAKDTDKELLWSELIKVGKEIEPGTPDDPTHKMPTPMVHVIVETLRFFGLNDAGCKLAYWDLLKAKYRIWDWLGMAYTGRLDAEGITFEGVEKLVKLYILQKDVGGFCWFLRGHDLEVEEPHRCEDCIESYKSWMEEIKANGGNPNDYE